MGLIQVIVVLVIVGVLLWLVQTYIPLAPPIKTIITVVVILFVVLWILSVFGILGGINDIHVGRIR
jgi:hypothetical protein